MLSYAFRGHSPPGAGGLQANSSTTKPNKEIVMAKRQWKKLLTVMVLGVFLVMGLTSLALAQVSQELKDAAKMMQNGWTQFNQGQRMVIQGKEMNDLVAVQQGAEKLMAPGNNVIKEGRDTMDRGAKLYAQGLKIYQDNLSTPSVAKQGLKMMLDGFHIAKDNGIAMVKKGITMNNQVAKQKGFFKQFSQGNQTIQTGFQTMEGGAKLFMQGEKLFLKLK
jgi:hypothetical protein